MIFTKFEKLSSVISSNNFSAHIFSHLLWDFDDVNVRSYVIVPQVAEAPLFFSICSFSLFHTG